jgi:alpha-mannosidase
MWSVAVGEYPRPELEVQWKTLLLNQFHDILPGSGIDWVYEDNVNDLRQVVVGAENVAARALETIAGVGDRFAIFNSTSHPRGGAPPCGWAVHASRPEPATLSITSGRMENDILRVEWDERGLLTSIWDKQVAREVLRGPGNLLQLHDDNPARWDAWDLDLTYLDAVQDLTDLEAEQLDRDGVRFQRRFGESQVWQRMILDGHVLRFETQVDWHERHKMLKVAFPVTVSSPEATYEIQFGHIRRPTHLDTPQAKAMFEVCAQRWADLGDGDYGVALLNDCKHGYDIHGSVMRLSLLRAPTHPDPNADQGHHEFTYALMPHAGDFHEAGVIEAAEDLNAPLRLVRSNLPRGTSRSLIEVDTPQVVVEAIKRAEDSDAAIVRLYEAWGRSCSARVRTTLPASRAYLCDLLERNIKEVALRDGEVDLQLTPFKILTLKLEP